MAASCMLHLKKAEYKNYLKRLKLGLLVNIVKYKKDI